MTLLQFSIKVIKEIRTWPLDSITRLYSGGAKTRWDEYKEQFQFDETFYYNEIRYAFREIVTQKVTDLPEENFNNLYLAITNINLTTNTQDRIWEVIENTLDQIMHLCRIQKIEYNKPAIKYVRYYVCGDAFIAEIVNQIDKDLYNVIEYSENHIDPGTKDYFYLKHLTEENGLEVISSEEFEREKDNLLSRITLQNKPIVY